MIRTILAVFILASSAAEAQTAFPQSRPGCSALTDARSHLDAAAHQSGYMVQHLDGSAARTMERGQDIPEPFAADHASILTNPHTGRAAVLLNDGKECAFGSVEIAGSNHVPPITAAVEFLNSAPR